MSEHYIDYTVDSDLVYKEVCEETLGEKALLMSMLDRRTRDMKSRNAQIREAAWHWFDYDVVEMASFLWVCEFLGLDPSVKRREAGYEPRGT